ncbi:uncharacterized protein LOC119326308 [Triticum dicoccoides]|uniref:uncharacterized protein LOC119326308 n=1 Tax=Triticum dicoccoides TaxID=85692 RepID=UPI00188E7D28|nr:uncharacterized protein LOC119326308 [Triticum dicoccoides]
MENFEVSFTFEVDDRLEMEYSNEIFEEGILERQDTQGSSNFAMQKSDNERDNNCTSTDDRNEEWNAKTRSRTKKERTNCIKRRKISSEDMQPTLYDRPKRIRREPAKYMG